jgi:secreted Zn-dependent insulinase-like peptidase
MRHPRDFCAKYSCTIVELAGLMGVSISLAQKWNGENHSISAYHQNHIELLDHVFELLKKAETEADGLKSRLCAAKLQFYLNWRSRDL